MISICLFNNKGGVGKTTLTCNIAAYFARKFKKKVLLVDCDPQCNTTQLVLNEEATSKLYRSRDTRHKTGTILDVLRPLQLGEPEISKGIAPMSAKSNRFGVDIIPGHPRLSMLEDILSQSWGEAATGKIGGIRKSNWCSTLVGDLEANYDIAFFDIGPSLGSLNRCVLLGVQHFISPVAADVFSVFGVRNIAEWLKQWLSDYQFGLGVAEKDLPGVLQEFGVRKDPAVMKGFAGYTVQQYITKSKQGIRRATVAYEKILHGIPSEVNEALGEYFSDEVTPSSMHLGDVPHMYSLVPLAQSANAPIMALTSSDGLAGSQFMQVEKYAVNLEIIARNLAKNIDMAVPA